MTDIYSHYLRLKKLVLGYLIRRDGLRHHRSSPVNIRDHNGIIMSDQTVVWSKRAKPSHRFSQKTSNFKVHVKKWRR